MNIKFLKNRKKAFTLAEVLMTLAVIGVVASMTIPTLLQNHQEKAYKAKWKTAYSLLSNVYGSIKADYNNDLSSLFTGEDHSADGLDILFREKFKILPTLRYDRYHTLNWNGYHKNYKSLVGEDVSWYNFNAGNFILHNGMQVFFRTYSGTHAVVWVDVDTNDNGPNVLGKDMFGAVITKDWIKPIGSDDAAPIANCEEVSVICNQSAAPGNNYGIHNPTPCAGAGCSALYLIE